MVKPPKDPTHEEPFAHLAAGRWSRRVTRLSETIFVPLPRDQWREITGGCGCVYCSADGKPAPSYWDTLAIGKKASSHTWLVHAPEFHGARKLRAE